MKLAGKITLWLLCALIGLNVMTTRTRALPNTQVAYEVLHQFGAPPEGGYPIASLLRATDGNFYGTTSNLGYGTVFQITPEGMVTIVHAFTGGTDGWGPKAALIQATDGNLYGTTEKGGSSSCHGGPGGCGTVFRVAPDGTGYTVLHRFSGETDGAHPVAALLQATDGNLYGTTSYGGAGVGGTIFRMALDDTFTVLHAFGSGTDGRAPEAPLIQATDRNFYGTTVEGGSSGAGTVFRMTPDGTVTILHAFDLASDGGEPRAALIQGLDGNLYGTSPALGGYLFQMALDGTYSSVTGLNFGDSYSALVQTADGTLYGAGWSDSGDGAVFKVILDVGVSVLHTFRFPNGGPPGVSALVQQVDGTFYGTTASGLGNVGTVFRMTPDGTTTVLHEFSPPQDGVHPSAGLIQADDGYLYGTTVTTLFRMATDGTLTVLHRLSEQEGLSPSALVQATNRNFYGTTDRTVLRMTPEGMVTILHTFTGEPDGWSPKAALIQATDGNLYGTTQYGGSSSCGVTLGCGTVFRIAPDGTGYTILHRFAGGANGSEPHGALLQATDGNFYGMNSTIFRMAPDGTLTVLHQVGGTSSLMQATDGNLYGVGFEGAFRLSPDGTFTVLNPLTDYNVNFRSSLIQASDGNFYGTAHPVVYQMTGDGRLTILHTFPLFHGDGEFSQAPLVQANDMNLYGTADGGITRNGVIFRIGLP